MAKNGQAKVLSNDELSAVFDEIEHHRYPAKNDLIIEPCFKLELRALGMSLLRIREIAALSFEIPVAILLIQVGHRLTALHSELLHTMPEAQ